jgi:hypothetical protein
VKDGASVFSEDIYVSETHEKWLSEDYFPLVCQIKRNPRYTNKRIMDPQLKCFVDETNKTIPLEWSLPTPNEEASYKSLAKYGKDLLPMSSQMVKDMNLAWTYTTRHFGLYMANARVLGFEEAKMKMDMSTSSGAPFNQLYKTKQELFEKDDEIDKWLQEDWETLGNNPMWTCLFTNSLKEELRTVEKIGENSIRTFLSGGVDAVVHGTRLFVDMNEKMYESHLKTSSAVGMSPFKGKWDTLYRKLKAFRKGYALDESQYDSSLRCYMMWGCAKLRWEMLAPEFRTKENLIRIQNYYRNLVNTLVIGPDGVIILKKTGNPSGSVNTINDNTLILYTLLAYAWIRTVDEDLRSYTGFEEHTAKALVGDDNTWTVSDEAHVYYNAVSVISEWKAIGVTTTTDSLQPRKPEDLDFLSAHTVFLDGKAVPVYNRTKMMTTLLYAPGAHITPATTLERVAALLGVGWTDIVFRNFCREAIAWLLHKYDECLQDEPRWIAAKCQIKTDDAYYRLFTGERMLTFYPQSLSGEFVKLTQPDKSIMNSAKPRRNGTKPGKKTRKHTCKTVQARPTQAQLARRARRRNRRAENRRVTKVTGKGGYLSDLGSRVGSFAGGKLGGMADSVFGLGAYGVRHNSLLADDSLQTSPSGPPRVINTAKGEATVFHHREFVGDIVSGAYTPGTTSTAFNLQRYQLNPGNSDLFPWLSTQAQGFQEYEVHGMLMQLITETADFSANFAIGNMMMSADYNPIATSPVSKVELLEMEYSASVKTSSDLIMPIECDRANNAQNHLWIALNNDYLGTDARSFDLAAVFVATQGQPAEQTKLAELWNTYEVWFYKPKLPDTFITGGGAHIQLANCTSGVPFGVAPAIMPGSGESFSIVTTADQIVFPEGNNRWFVLFHWIGAGVGLVSAFTPTVVNGDITSNPMFATAAGNDLAANIVFGTGPAFSSLMQSYVLSTSGSCTLTLGGGALPAGVVFGDVHIYQVPDDLLT